VIVVLLVTAFAHGQIDRVVGQYFTTPDYLCGFGQTASSVSPNRRLRRLHGWGKRMMEDLMFSRLLTVALLTAGTALAFSTAQAQTSGSSGTSSGTGSSTMTPSTGSGSSTMGSGSGSTSSTMGSGSTSTQQAQQPMSSGTFNATNYKTKTECLNAASAQHADRTLCDALK